MKITSIFNLPLPPAAGTHRCNRAKRAVQAFKNHLIAGLCTVYSKFPLNLWDKWIPQAVLTLNLLQSFRINPCLSTYAQVHGAFDCNQTPLAPPEIKFLVHICPEDRTSWAPHTIQVFYIGPAMEHYRYHKVCTPSTNSIRISKPVKWLPHNFKMPTASHGSLILVEPRHLRVSPHSPHLELTHSPHL